MTAPRCSHCGGQAFPDFDGALVCVNCGREAAPCPDALVAMLSKALQDVAEGARETPYYNETQRESRRRRSICTRCGTGFSSRLHREACGVGTPHRAKAVPTYGARKPIGRIGDE